MTIQYKIKKSSMTLLQKTMKPFELHPSTCEATVKWMNSKYLIF